MEKTLAAGAEVRVRYRLRRQLFLLEAGVPPLSSSNVPGPSRVENSRMSPLVQACV